MRINVGEDRLFDSLEADEGVNRTLQGVSGQHFDQNDRMQGADHDRHGSGVPKRIEVASHESEPRAGEVKAAGAVAAVKSPYAAENDTETNGVLQTKNIFSETDSETGNQSGDTDLERRNIVYETGRSSRVGGMPWSISFQSGALHGASRPGCNGR